MRTDLSDAELNAMVRKHKANLDYAKKRRDHKQIIEVCTAALAEFEQTSYPDNWHLWQRAKEDAEFALMHED